MHAPPRGEGLICWEGRTAWRQPEAKAQQSAYTFRLRRQRPPRLLAVCVCSRVDVSRASDACCDTFQRHVSICRRRNTFSGGQFSLTMREWAQTLTTRVKICAGNELHRVHLQLPIVPVDLNSTAGGHGLLMSLTAHTRTHTHTHR